MPNQEKPLTPSAIGYLLILSEFCRDGRGARCIDVAARMNVSKPSAHAMIRNLCEMQLAEKEHYGIVYLTQAGRKAAALYETCYEPLFARMQDVLALDGDAGLHERQRAHIARDAAADSLVDVVRAEVLV